MSKPAQNTVTEIWVSLELGVILPLTTLALKAYPLTDEEFYPLMNIRFNVLFVLQLTFSPTDHL